MIPIPVLQARSLNHLQQQARSTAKSLPQIETFDA